MLREVGAQLEVLTASVRWFDGGESSKLILNFLLQICMANLQETEKLDVK